MSEEYTAVLDRFEESTAVLLLERDGEQVDELLVNRRVLPERGRQQDAVFDLVRSADEVTIRYREDETEARRERAGSRFDRLSSTLPGETDEDS